MVEEDQGWLPSAPLDIEYDNNITQKRYRAIAIALNMHIYSTYASTAASVSREARPFRPDVH